MRFFQISEEEAARREELAQARQAVKEKLALHKMLIKEARYYEKVLSNALARLGYQHWLRKEARPDQLTSLFTGRGPREQVRFLPGKVREDALFFRVDVMRLPHQTTIMDLGLEETLITLGAACQRRITLVDNRDEPERGVWYVLHRQGFVGAIPKRFRFKSALDAIPKSAGPLRYTAGVGMNLQLVQPDLAFGPHLLIAGSPGAGKSNHLNSILMQFLLRNSPDTLEIYMIDLKGGMELQDYENLPHVKRFVKEPEEVPDLLAQFSSELKTRETKFAAASVRDLAGWNRLHREKQLPRMLLVIDELAQVLLNLDKKLAKDAGIALVSTISVSRAPGGHAILCTQRPSSDIVLPVIKVNCPLRVAFRVPSHFDSAVILDQAGAEKLGQPGRAIMVNGPDVREMQTPLITPRMIRLGINKVGENGRKVVKGPDITIEDVARRALENYHGAVPARQIELDLRDRASSTQIRRAIEALDESPVEVDGITYQTIRRTNGHGGKEMRQLVPITNHQIPDFPQTGMITRRGRIVDLKGSRE